MTFSRGVGPEEAAFLVFAHTVQEARKISFSEANGALVEEWTDYAAWLMRSDWDYVYTLADQDKLTAGTPHTIDNPPSCNNCWLWGFRTDADGRCANCGELSGLRPSYRRGN